MIKCVQVTFSGHVQGIFFRTFIKDHAINLSIAGYVKNLQTGEVEAMFQGRKENIEQMLQQCKKGPPLASIKEMKVKEGKPKKEFREFKVLH